MVSEARKQSMAWIETDYSKHTHFQWKIKWRLEHLGALGIMGETAPSLSVSVFLGEDSIKCILFFSVFSIHPSITSGLIRQACSVLSGASTANSSTNYAPHFASWSTKSTHESLTLDLR